jgi:hypothetical protein
MLFDQPPDILSRLERAIYSTLALIGFVGAFVCLFLSLVIINDSINQLVTYVGLVFVALMGIFGVALKNNRRIIFFTFLRRRR